MKVFLGPICLIVLLIPSLKADKFQEYEDELVQISPANEIFIHLCSSKWFKNRDTTTWYKNDSNIPISVEQGSRIHQFQDKLWFVPAHVEDSGHYYCVLRNSTYFFKLKINLKFVENDPNLCYSTQVVFPQKLPMGQRGQLVCPKLFLNENHGFPTVEWYKDCKPLLLDNVTYFGEKNKLILMKVTEEHKGKYSCQAFYRHLDKQYRMTRVIEFTPVVKAIMTAPLIISPVNETVEVELGSQIQLICNVTDSTGMGSFFWQWNGSTIPEEDQVLVEDYQIMKLQGSKKQIIIYLNISQVERKFYLYPFTCKATNWLGYSVAYVQFVHPVREFQMHVIGVFIMLTVLITCSIFTYKFFKIDIVLWYRDFCYVFLPKKASDEKIYDAYILYPKTLQEGSSTTSDIFVFKVLPEVLEKQCGYNLFIYGRDDYIGEDIVEVVYENIKKSRRLIIILVQDALEFSWMGSTSEEQIAMYSALIQDGMKVILLELEKIQDYKEMSESIKFIRQKHRAIRWSGNFTEKSLSPKTRFWKNVRYHMPAQPKVPLSTHNFLSIATTPNSVGKSPGELRVPLG
ncbi:PREDICTED: interleukin-1 receptor type 1 [Elephantulus edwardii]|uniref:interleukin-1 receptor type 1 n=1 Tax=Elephantulus edwardii TaxID=28737 RepID=UPI0003F061D5|nr:PREDICTED: interleukin-1 receptor type 1 [Elephantulus edwardii]